MSPVAIGKATVALGADIGTGLLLGQLLHMPHLRPCAIGKFYALFDAVRFAVELRSWRGGHWINAERCQRFVSDASREGRARVVLAQVSKRVGELAGLVVDEFDVHGLGNVVGPNGIIVCAYQKKFSPIRLEESVTDVPVLQNNEKTLVVAGRRNIPCC